MEGWLELTLGLPYGYHGPFKARNSRGGTRAPGAAGAARQMQGQALYSSGCLNIKRSTLSREKVSAAKLLIFLFSSSYKREKKKRGDDDGRFDGVSGGGRRCSGVGRTRQEREEIPGQARVWTPSG
jgi:hypothetical protein